MIILDADAPIFKKWVIKKLEDMYVPFGKLPNTYCVLLTFQL